MAKQPRPQKIDANLYSSDNYKLSKNAATTTPSIIAPTGFELDFSKDSSGATILLDNGDNFPVNYLEAVEGEYLDEIWIRTIKGQKPVIKGLDWNNITIEDAAAGISLASAITNLNDYLTGVIIGAGSNALDDLSDVTITSPQIDEVLKWNGSAWVNDTDTFTASFSLEELTDTNIPAPNTNDVLVFDGAEWIAAPDLDKENLSELDDVVIAVPATGEVLKWDGVQWGNADVDYSEIVGSLPESQVTAHEAALSITESQISDLQAYLTSTGSIDSHTDVTVTTPSTGEVLKWDGAGWVNSADEGALQLNDLSDVATGVPSAGQVLKFNGTNWINDTDDKVINIDDIDDVIITSASTGQFLKFNGTHWVNVADATPQNIDDLSDVSLGTPSTGQVLTYNGTSWTNQNNDGSGATQLDELSDVLITSAATGEVLRFNGTNWVDTQLDYADLANTPSNVSAFTNDAGYITGYTVTQGDVTAHEAALTITESQISDLGAYLTSLGSIGGHTDVTVTAAATGEVLRFNGTAWVDATLDYSDLSGTPSNVSAFTNDSGYITGYTVTEGDVTAHEAALNITESQITDLQAYLTSLGSVNGHTDVTVTTPSAAQVLRWNGTAWVNATLAYGDLSGTPTNVSTFTNDSGYITDYTVTEADVTNHEAALTITESQISDLGAYLTSTGSINSHTDVVITTPSNGQVLKYNGTNWINDTDSTGGGGGALNDITDVTITSAATGEVLRYNGSAWVDATLAYSDLSGTPTNVSTFTNDSGYLTSVGSIGGHTDVTITGATTGEVLRYNGSAWVDATLAYGDLSGTPTNVSSFTNDSGYITGYTVTEGDVTAHEAALTITESQISDLGAYLTALGPIGGHSDVTITAPTTGEVLRWNGTAWVDATLAYSDLSGTPTNVSSFTNDSGYITDYTVTQGDVTAHEAALTITESQISDLGSYLTSTGSINSHTDVVVTAAATGEVLRYDGANWVDAQLAYGDLSGTPTNVSQFTNDSGYITGYTVTEGDVTAHEAALTITESQISDLGSYLTSTGSIDSHTDVTVTTPAAGNVLRYSGTAWLNTALPYSDLTGAPTNVSAFANDSGYITGYTVTESDVTAHQAALSITESQISDLQAYLTTLGSISGHSDVTITGAATGEVLRFNGTAWVDAQLAYSDLTGTPTNVSTFTNDSGYITDYTVTEGDVTAHEAALTITESQISDLGVYLTSTGSINSHTDVVITTPSNGQVLKYNGTNWINDTDATGGGGGALNDLTDVTISSAATGEVIRYNGSAWVDTQLAYSDLSGTPTNVSTFTNDSGYLTTLGSIGGHSDVTITGAASGEVLRHNGTNWVDAVLDYSDLSGTPTNVSTFTNDSGYITSYTVTEGDVTAHEAALTITESQISDLGSYITSTQAADINMAGFDLTDVHEIKIDAIPDTDATANGFTFNDLSAGQTLAMGDLVYLNGSAQWVDVDASASATAGPVMLACALEAGTASNPVKVTAGPAVIRNDAWAWTVGGILYVSETAGEFTQTAPTTSNAIVRVVGYALSADVIYFDPDKTWVTVA